ncbi:MAG: 3-dehydroquinate synthase [Rhodospirillaceae bacterium]|jgi:3-dehydroquinate synthase
MTNAPSKTVSNSNGHTVTVRVDLGERSYDILIGENLLDNAGAVITEILRQPRVIVITDSNVASLHLPALETSLSKAGIETHSIILPAGEQTKDFAHLAGLLDQCLDARIARDTTLIALGGGVIGDITGFAAAIALRGIDFIQIPTTLLAQVDSSVGGKTGINTKHGKNLVGAFHQPALVLADVATLDTLPEREIRAGYGEVVKYGLINDAPFFNWLEKNGPALCNGEHAARIQAVETCCRAKAAIVAADEHESGQRALLNLGHTFGHAFEAESGYSDKLLHGEAVAIGMVMAFSLSGKLGLCNDEETARIAAHLKAVNLPASLSGIAEPSWTPARLLSHMSQDKKVLAGQLTFILARRIGEAFISRDVKPETVQSLLEEALAA